MSKVSQTSQLTKKAGASLRERLTELCERFMEETGTEGENEG
jgi:hypothetical protein